MLEPDDPPQSGGKLVVAVPADTNGWNPNINQWTDGGQLMGPSMIEPLATINADGEAVPFLAQGWKSNQAFTEWEITVREGVRFHNGQVLDASALKRSLDAYALTGLSSIELKPQYDRTVISGPRSVTVYLKKEWAQFPSSLASAYMLAPAMLDREDQGTVFPIGTGPFRFVDWQINKHLKVTRWDGYWRKDSRGAQLPHLDSIEFRPILADDARQSAMQAGQLDMMLTSSPATAALMEPSHTVLRNYNNERTMLMLNTAAGEENKDNPFTNVHARKALAMSTDSLDIARMIGEDVQVTKQPYRADSRWGLPPDQTGYPDYDPEGARRELDIYLRDTGRKELKFTLKGVPEPRLVAVFQRAQAQWAKLGIKATIDTMDQVKFSLVVALGNYEAAYYRGYGSPNPDMDRVFHAEANLHEVGELSLNFTHYTSPEFERSLRTQRENTDFGVRKAAVHAMAREINEQVLYVWLFDTPWAFIAQKRVRGLNNFRTHPFANFVTKPWWGDVWLKA